ncbi:ATP adenylyltransferase family protein [Hyalangium gracile]|uniref:ATP adenylyltransferase family protein n=1 Tax=Hyalangium gracile TaxID=394092 RepID=UPI001CC938E1|nr:phosphorylase [Hyalangium gracile]
MRLMVERSPNFERGTLWRTVVERTARALASGALVPIHTEVEVIQDEGVPFLVRVVSNLERKARAVQPPSDGKPPKNPFIPPYEEDLFVSLVPPAHACLLNKFNVFDHHALLVTQAYEEQDSLLTLADFEALLACMAEFDSLAFYNGGRLAGASQPHKHLQLVPVPLAAAGLRTPMDEAIARGRLPFRHALGPAPQDADQAHATYLRLLREVGCEQAGTPYNLLATREWTLVVPRTQETFDSISLNALAFAGSLLVKNREQLERVRAVGPMALLRAVTGTSGGQP